MKPGLYSCADLSNKAYHASAGVSCSGLKILANQTPAHYWAAYLDPDRERQETRPQLVGTALHAATLEPEAFAEAYIESPFPTRQAAGYKAWAAEQSRVILTPTEARHVVGMRRSLQAHPTVRRLLAAPGDFEASLYVEDPETGHLGKCRYDKLLHNGWALDLKKTQDASDRGVAKATASYDYHMQAAWYGDLYAWAMGRELGGMVFVFVEEQPPHAVSFHTIAPEDIERGRMQYRRALDVYAQCLESGQWPAYPTAAGLIELPQWKRREIDYSTGDAF